MARKPRIEYPDAVYHISCRGNNRQVIFRNENDRNEFLGIIGGASNRFDLEIFAFCLMDNHFHLLVRTPLANISGAMHWINTTYTVRFNRRHTHIGHIFQGRYNSVLVLEEAHWLHLSMYIHLNPVRAGLVDDPAQYEWSSFLDYIRARPRYKWLKAEEILESYGRGGASRRRAYRKQCLGLSGRKPSFLGQIRGGAILGPREKLEKILEKFKENDIDNKMRVHIRPFKKVYIRGELARVAEIFGVEYEDMIRRRRNFPPRFAAYYHLVEHCGISMTRVSEEMGVTIPAVSYGIRQMKKYIQNDMKIKNKIERLFFYFKA